MGAGHTLSPLLRHGRFVVPVAALVAAAWALYATWSDVPAWRRFEFRDGRVVRVERIHHDGGIDVGDGIVVRLIGVEVPTAVADRIAFVIRLERLVGSEVILRFDRERVDPEGRVLAFVESDGADLGTQLVAAGLARLDRRAAFSSSTKRAMEKAEQSPRDAGLGVWATERD